MVGLRDKRDENFMKISQNLHYKLTAIKKKSRITPVL